jgi:hypothetical protein
LLPFCLRVSFFSGNCAQRSPPTSYVKPQQQCDQKCFRKPSNMCYTSPNFEPYLLWKKLSNCSRHDKLVAVYWDYFSRIFPKIRRIWSHCTAVICVINGGLAPCISMYAWHHRCLC